MSGAVKKVVCAMSGGVDSSVAALLLKNRGFQVQGVFMRNWDIADEKGQCQADREKEDAEYACKKIGIPLLEVNFVKEYWHNVFSYLINEYKAGYTPNPDIHCNKKIKFDLFFKYALKNLKADAVATGHYARIAQSSDLPEKGFKLLKGVDKQKDQTFFLAQIPKYSLEKCIFPVGEMTKDIVKKIAAAAGLDRIVQKRESVGICFIGRRNFQEFIDDYIEPLEGNFINVENKKIVGKHKGVHCWTIGQRCALPGQPSAFYVAERDVITQDILVAPGRMHPALFHQTVVTENPYWINKPSINFEKGESFQCEFRFQHREPLVNCLMYQDSEGKLQIYLEKPLRALTPGQYAVFYTGDECLGSAKILYRGPSMYVLDHMKNKDIL
ncbi:mitochondrial tRNA-specific 2-thiouridylase 1 [Trichonephila inaurata madagascariensis]|uniref:tRNA-5-taurinomethyluridine 2-sulfurtransferase n=1 Tax=Trichonephila inaurata madagascariensis TaxID=2747483 RepID=A0A8X7CS72_9ARAC|nr:mitochondrial tRNA-specific 2-thiouridylase 1 [Trichonephila inaurata madagascariensis]